MTDALIPARTMRFVGWVGSCDRCSTCGKQSPDGPAALMVQPAVLKTISGRRRAVIPERQQFVCQPCMRGAFQFEEVR